MSRFQNNIRSRHGGVTGCVYENIQVEYSIVDIVQSICYAAWIGEYLVMDLATLLGDVHCILHREGGGDMSCSWIIRDTDISVLARFFSSKVWRPGKTQVNYRQKRQILKPRKNLEH